MRCICIFQSQKESSKMILSPQARIALLEKALSASLRCLTPYIPGDSRAVPDWFVAMALVLDNTLDEEASKPIEKHLDDVLAWPTVENVLAQSVEITFVSGPEDIKPPRSQHSQELEDLLTKARHLPPMSEDDWLKQRDSLIRGFSGD